jgi:hypothetical protein
LPVGGDDWLAAVRGAQRDLKVFEGYPNGHPLGAADHEKIGRYCAADRLFRNHHVEIIHGLLIALASADTHPKGQDREDGLGS